MICWLRKNKGQVYLWFCTLSRLHLKVDSCRITTPFWEKPQKTPANENFHSGQIFRQFIWSHIFFRRKKWPDVRLFTNSWTVSMGWMNSQGLGKTIIGKIGEKYIWMKNIWMAVISPNKQRMWRYLCPALMSIKKWLQQKGSSAIKERRWPVLWIINLFPQLSLSLFNPLGSWEKWPWWQRWKQCMGSTKCPTTTKVDKAIAADEYQICHYQGRIVDPQILHHFSRWTASEMVAGWLHCTTSFMEMTTLCPYWCRNLFWLWFALLHVMRMQNHYLWTYRIPDPSSWYSTQYCFWPRNSLHR